MKNRALIFDCDGVLADTERDGHRVAFNEMFRQVGLDLEWDDASYAELVHIGGGKERLASVLTPEFVASAGLPEDPQAQKELLARWHRIKTERYKEIVGSGALPPRPGVKRLMAEALGAGWAVAIASTSAQDSVVAVLSHVVGEEMASRILIFAGDVVARKKPAPDIYRYALEHLEVSAREAVVIEDSAVGLRASRGAGLATIVTVSAYTAGENFEGATAVLSDLGGPCAPLTVLADPRAIGFGEVVDLAALERVLRHAS